MKLFLWTSAAWELGLLTAWGLAGDIPVALGVAAFALGVCLFVGVGWEWGRE